VTAGSTRILVVDDERPIRRALEVTLAKTGYTVSTAIDASEALTQAALQPPDLVILDLMLPDADGLEVCRRLRTSNDLPILMLTARGEPMDRVIGLEVGADDYLTKPFNPRELLARIRAVLRRAHSLPPKRGTPRTRAMRFDRWVLEIGRRELVGEDYRSARQEAFALWPRARRYERRSGRKIPFFRLETRRPR